MDIGQQIGRYRAVDNDVEGVESSVGRGNAANGGRPGRARIGALENAIVAGGHEISGRGDTADCRGHGDIVRQCGVAQTAPGETIVEALVKAAVVAAGSADDERARWCRIKVERTNIQATKCGTDRSVDRGPVGAAVDSLEQPRAVGAGIDGVDVDCAVKPDLDDRQAAVYFLKRRRKTAIDHLVHAIGYRGDDEGVRARRWYSGEHADVANNRVGRDSIGPLRECVLGKYSERQEGDAGK